MIHSKPNLSIPKGAEDENKPAPFSVKKIAIIAGVSLGVLLLIIAVVLISIRAQEAKTTTPSPAVIQEQGVSGQVLRFFSSTPFFPLAIKAVAHPGISLVIILGSLAVLGGIIAVAIIFAPKSQMPLIEEPLVEKEAQVIQSESFWQQNQLAIIMTGVVLGVLLLGILAPLLYCNFFGRCRFMSKLGFKTKDFYDFYWDDDPNKRWAGVGKTVEDIKEAIKRNLERIKTKCDDATKSFDRRKFVAKGKRDDGTIGDRNEEGSNAIDWYGSDWLTQEVLIIEGNTPNDLKLVTGPIDPNKTYHIRDMDTFLDNINDRKRLIEIYNDVEKLALILVSLPDVEEPE